MQGNNQMVELRSYIPGIAVELRYATQNNFTGRVIYDFTEAWLRKGTADKLKKVQQSLVEQRLGLKVWDAFRPIAAQFILWNAKPDAHFVADPYHGYSNHSRGNAVDLTLIDIEGNELEMPTEFDHFSEAASRHYEKIGEKAKTNALLLQNLMEYYGFSPDPHEWWHYNDIDSYEVYREKLK